MTLGHWSQTLDIGQLRVGSDTDRWRHIAMLRRNRGRPCLRRCLAVFRVTVHAICYLQFAWKQDAFPNRSTTGLDVQRPFLEWRSGRMSYKFPALRRQRRIWRRLRGRDLPHPYVWVLMPRCRGRGSRLLHWSSCL